MTSEEILWEIGSYIQIDRTLQDIFSYHNTASNLNSVLADMLYLKFLIYSKPKFSQTEKNSDCYNSPKIWLIKIFYLHQVTEYSLYFI